MWEQYVGRYGPDFKRYDGPDFKRKAPSVGEMAALGKARESIKRVKLITQTTVPIIDLGKLFVVRKINKTIWPGNVWPRKKRASVQIRVCVLGDEVSKKVIVRFTGCKNVPLVEVKQGNGWPGRGLI